MFSFAFSRFYLPRDGTKTAHPHACHCYKHLLMGWNEQLAQWRWGGRNNEKKMSHDDKNNVTGWHWHCQWGDRWQQQQGRRPIRRKTTRRTTTTWWQGEPLHDDEDNHYRMMTGTGMDNNMTWQKQQQCMRRRTTRMGQEWKVQVMDPAPYNEEHKKGPKRRCWHLLGRR